MLVLDKPAGLVVHPAPGHASGTLVNALLHHCADLAGVGGVLRPGIVHRLDQGTSGVLVVAKNDAAHRALAEQFRDHSIERIYRALVRGVPVPDAGRSRSADRPASARTQAHVGARPRGARGPHRLACDRALSGERARLARGASRNRSHAPDPRASRGGGLPDRGRSGVRTEPRERGRARRAPRCTPPCSASSIRAAASACASRPRFPPISRACSTRSSGARQPRERAAPRPARRRRRRARLRRARAGAAAEPAATAAGARRARGSGGGLRGRDAAGSRCGGLDTRGCPGGRRDRRLRADPRRERQR